MLAVLATLLVAASSSLPGGPPGFARDPADVASDPRGAATPPRPPPLPATVPSRRKWNPLMDTLMDEFSVLNDARRANISALGVDKAKWEARQAETAQHLEALFYPLERNSTPPAYTVTGEIHHPSGFTMQKILYETRPGLFASGSLWVPDRAKAAGAKLPAVLLVSGHTSDGWRNNGRSLGDCTGPLDNCTGPDTTAGGGEVPHPHGPKSPLGPFKGNPGGYQLALWNLVHKGFVALAFDPIGQGERLEYVRAGEVASKGHNWGTFEHEYLARQLFLAGRSAASFWVHDEMRSVDLMAALPFVDADNLGVCGCSGGGTQSSYLGSVDKRIKAASIACYMSTLETDYNYNYGGEYDGEQTWPRAAIYSLDKPDLVEVRAPKPTQILLTTEDNCFPFAGGQRAAAEAQAAFNATGTPEALDVSISAYHHGWDNQNREAMYSFFLKHLGQSNHAAGSANGGGGSGSGGIVDSIEWWPDGFGNISGLFNASQLQVTSTGQVRTAPECAPNKIYHDFTQQIAAQKLAALQARRTDREAPQFFSYIRGVVAAVSGFRAPLEEPRPVAAGMVESPSWVKLAGEGQCMIEVLVTPPSVFATAAGAAAVVVIGSDAGSFEPALLTNLTAAGHTVVEAKLCGFEKPHTAFPTSCEYWYF
jgi:dienelactone hydrolase